MTLQPGLTSWNEIQAEKMRRSLAFFVRKAWEVLEPSKPLIWNWHIDVICEHVQALFEDRLGKQNLIINVPPGSMKSTILSVCLPAWVWAHKHVEGSRMGPSWSGTFASGSQQVAMRDSIKCRDLLDSRWYRQTFRPEWGWTRDQNEKGHYRNSEKGFRRATPAGAKITGDRSDDLIVDDPNDAEAGDADRGAIISWWDNAAYNRLNDMRTGHRVIIQQRLHEEDLTGHILETDRDAWAVLVIRQEWEPPQKSDPDFLATPLGWVDPRTTEGDLFFPERFPPDVVEAEKRVKGSLGYAGQHQQRPMARGGNLVKTSWFKRYDDRPHRDEILYTVQSWDTAYKPAQVNDPSVCTTWARMKDGRKFLLDVFRERLEYPDLKRKVIDLRDTWKPNVVLIEDKASGQSLIQELRGKFTIIPMDTEGQDKMIRLIAVSPQVEAGDVWLPYRAPWLTEYEMEMAVFPNGAHDDQVDSTSQALKWMTAQSVEFKLAGIGK